jgi:cytochrome c biogenesis protein CcmG/thiol:disulfide interchange protein DsbE
MAQSKRLLLYLLPLAVFVALTLLLWSGVGKDPTHLDSQLEGQPLPTFRKPDLLQDGVMISNQDIKGPALINVWASWCPACYHEHKFISELATRGEVPVWGLNYRDQREDAMQFLNEQGNPFVRVIFDEDGRLGIDLGVYGAPETFAISADGRIVYRHVGVLNEQVWQKTIKPLLFPAEPATGAEK